MKHMSSLRSCHLAVRACLIASVLAFGNPLRAQEPPQSSGSLAAVRPGLLVTIVDDTGRTTKGIVQQASESALHVETRGIGPVRRTFTRDELAKVTQADSRWSGFWIGFVAGAVPGFWFANGVNQYCYNETPSHCPSAFALFGGGAALLGGWIGASIDGAVDGGPVLYSRQLARPTVRVQPTFSPSTGTPGVSLSVTF